MVKADDCVAAYAGCMVGLEQGSGVEQKMSLWLRVDIASRYHRFDNNARPGAARKNAADLGGAGGGMSEEHVKLVACKQHGRVWPWQPYSGCAYMPK